MDCRSPQETYSRSFSGSCDHHTLDHGPVVMVLGTVSGAVVLLLVLRANRGLARDENIGRAVWLRAAPLVLLPFAVVWALA
ncbi:hypothetical protein ACIREE_32375 [Streptomyces sp. NPDC102467]|uniref:hypothetical protein n=1 Tax=Streptomyces sp. NPDC102467 TaxID=3366179 RepID=UPI00382A1D3C